MADEYFSGLVKTEESRAYMLATSRPYAAPSNPIEPLKEFDPTPNIIIEFQRRRNACVGVSLSSCGEACAMIDSGFKFKGQYSGWGMYIWSQELGGMGGKDNGAQLRGGIRAATERGFPPKEVWPYPQDSEKYSMREPAGARESAAPNKIVTQVGIQSREQGQEFQSQGRGVLWFGTKWTTGMANGRGPITMADLNTKVIGAHAYYVWGWDKDGNWIMINSHDVSYGMNGVRKMTPQAADWLIEHDEVYGFTDMTNIEESRPLIDFSQIV